MPLAAWSSSAVIAARKLRPSSLGNDTPRRALITGIGGQDGSYLAELAARPTATRFSAWSSATPDAASSQPGRRARPHRPRRDRPDRPSGRRELDLRHRTGRDLQPRRPVGRRRILERPASDDRVHDRQRRRACSRRSWRTRRSALLPGDLLRDLPRHRPEPAERSRPRRGPISPYGVGKLAGHALVARLSRAPRPACVVGDSLQPRVAAPPGRLRAQQDRRRRRPIKLGRQNRPDARRPHGARRDWGYALDFVEAMLDDAAAAAAGRLRVATGKTHSVDELVRRPSPRSISIQPNTSTTDPTFLRGEDEAQLVGDPSHIAKTVGWSAQTSFEDLVKVMVESRMREFQTEAQPG